MANFVVFSLFPSLACNRELVDKILLGEIAQTRMIKFLENGVKFSLAASNFMQDILSQRFNRDGI
jgi:hypothetical protein